MTWDEWRNEVDKRDIVGKKVCAYCCHASVEDYISFPKMLCFRDDMKRGKYVPLYQEGCEHHRFHKAYGLNN